MRIGFINTNYLIIGDIYNIFDRCQIIRNSKNFGPAYSRYVGYTKCNDSEVVVLLDGDDWLIGHDVLSYLNKEYKEGAEMTYGRFFYWNGDNDIKNGYMYGFIQIM